MEKHLISSVALLFFVSFLFSSCSNEPKRQPPLKIQKELKLHGTSILDKDDTKGMYIRCEDKLHRYFPNLDSEPGLAELKKINFDKQTLLIGRAYYAHDAEISYRIALDLNNDKTGRDNCTLYVTIKGDEVPKEEGFIWGCIVNRILPDTDVHFEITKE